MEKKKKIVFIATKGDQGGAQKYIKQLVLGIDKNKFELVVISGNYGEDLTVKKKLKWLGNESGFLFYKDISALIELVRVLKKEKPEIIHLNSSKAGVVGAIAAKLAGIKKIIFTAHGWVFSDETLPFFKKFFYIFLHRVAGFFQDKIINVSEYDKKIALKYRIAPEKKLETILNGIDTNYFKDNFFSKEEARKEIKNIISNGKFLVSNQIIITNEQEKKIGEFWIGTIGRLVKEKNYQLLIKAIKNLKDEVSELKIKCLIIGDGYEKENLKTQIANYKLEEDVFLLGEIKNAFRYLKAFDLFVLPSRKEGLPFTLIEAMAAEIPVLTSDVGGMTEVIEEEKGWLFQSENEKDLVKKAEEVLNSEEEAKRRAEKARRFAEQILNEKRMILETEKIYEENL